MTDPVVSSPDPTWNSLCFTLLRSILIVGSSLGAYHGTVSDSALQVVAGAIVTVGAAAWGVYDQYQKAKKDHEGSVISAKTGLPQRVI